jgi:hypothetical protein
MLIDHPVGFGKKFIGSSIEPTPMSRKEIVDAAKQVSELLDQSYVMVAILVADNFPDSELRLSGDEDKVEFTLYFKDHLMLTVNFNGWKVEGEDLAWKWEDVKEGNPETVAESILRNFAQKDYSVFDPSGGMLARKRVKRPLVKFED